MRPIGQTNSMLIQPAINKSERPIPKDIARGDTSSRQLSLSNSSLEDRLKFFRDVEEDLNRFIERADRNWDDKEDYRRYTIFGDCITCIRWYGNSLVSGLDIVKIVKALYRVKTLGGQPVNRKKFEEAVMADLRFVKINDGVFLEEANSGLLRIMYKLNAVKTHKRQKIFLWGAVPFSRLANDALAREARINRIVRVPSLASRRDSMSSTGSSSPGLSTDGLLALAAATDSDYGVDDALSSPDSRQASISSPDVRSSLKTMSIGGVCNYYGPSSSDISNLEVVANAASMDVYEKYENFSKDRK